MQDRFESHAQSLVSPASDGFVITPDDNSDLPQATRAIYVGGAGTLCLCLQPDLPLRFVAVPAGSVLPLRAQRVMATGTTATDLVGLL